MLTGTGPTVRWVCRPSRRVGGTVIAQDEESAEFFGMPQAAIETGSVDFVLPLGEIARCAAHAGSDRRGG